MFKPGPMLDREGIKDVESNCGAAMGDSLIHECHNPDMR